MKPKFTVTFEYDEAARKWDVFIHGAANELEALQGFNAVILTCAQAIPEVSANKAMLMADNVYKISVGVL